jgi:CO/xanthine dehydrogenase Mo-binding subunit
MLYAVVARCPVFGGSIARYDETAARAVPGVRAVVPVDAGVAVVATSTWSALQGRDALSPVWNEGPNVALSSESIRAMFVKAAASPGAVAELHGEPATALTRAATRRHGVFEVPFLAHATMEPMNCTASVEKNRCEIWASTQDPGGVRSEGARIAGCAEENVIVHTTLLGGGFGRRFETDVVTDALQVSRAIRAPVKVTWTREDDMQHDFYRPASYHVLEGGLDTQGRLVALTHRIVAPSITGQRNPEQIEGGLDESAVEGAVKMPYTIPNRRVEYIMANTPVPIGYWRSVYPSQNVFAVECFIDELAAAAKRDPLEFRISMMGDFPRFKRVLERAAEKAGWGESLPAGRARGVAFSPPAFFHTPVAQVVEVSLGKDNRVRVHRVVCVVDCGIVINPDGVEAQMEGGIIYGLTAALNGRITIDGGRVVQGNFDDYPLLTIDEMPVIEVAVVPSAEPPTGTGEPGLPAIAPAVANAVSALTGRRVRSLPISAAG